MTHRSHCICGTTVALTLLAALVPVSADPAPPAARETDAVDRAFGLVLPDPYRWMEGESNAEFKAWLQAQAAATRAALDASPRHAVWQRQLKEVSRASTINGRQRRVGERIFFQRVETGRRAVLMVRDANGKERILVDPNALGDAGGPAGITEFSPSADGRLVAVNIDRGGSEVTTVSVIDVVTGSTLPDRVQFIWGELSVSWLPDGSGFAYTQMAPPSSVADPMQNMHVRMHRLGQPVGEDPVTVAPGANASLPLQPVESPSVDLSADSNWAIAKVETASSHVRLCMAPKTEAVKPGAHWRCLVDYDDEVQGWGLHGDALLLLSTKGAANGRVLALDLAKPAPRLADARVVLPESAGAVLTGVAAARDGLYVRRMTDGIDDVVRLPWTGGPTLMLTMPFVGAAYHISADPAAEGLVYTLQSWKTPRRAYVYNPADKSSVDLNLGGNSPADYSEVTSLEITAISADGTRVPLSIVYRRDLERDGKALALLDGYGAYGISTQPYFDPMLLEWVRAGHVYAVAHVRGGGERGRNWWQGGKSAAKYKGVEDFVACSAALTALKFSSPARIGATGASAGGLLIGGAITAAPAQFGAAVIHAGVLNPVRLLAQPNGANQIAELADPTTSEGLHILAAMDPMHRVRDGLSYPAVLLDVGLNDSRVAPWESGKFGARLAKAGKGSKPVWFRISGDQGHFSGSLDERAAEVADTYTFLEMQLAH